jgi:hypothetical protein
MYTPSRKHVYSIRRYFLCPVQPLVLMYHKNQISNFSYKHKLRSSSLNFIHVPFSPTHSYGRPVSMHLQSNEIKVGTSYQLNNSSLRISHCSKSLCTLACFRELSLKKVPFFYVLCSWVRASWITINNCQQDATLYSFYSLLTALHVSGDSFTHHQEHE